MAKGWTRKKKSSSKVPRGTMSEQKYIIKQILDDKTFDKYNDGEVKDYLQIQWEYKNGRTYVKPTWEPSEIIEEDAPRAFNEYFENKRNNESSSVDEQSTDEDIASDQSSEFQRDSDKSVDSEVSVEAPAVVGPVDEETESESNEDENDDDTESVENQENTQSADNTAESEPIIEAPSPAKSSRKRKAKQVPEPTVDSFIRLPVTKKSKRK